MIFLTGDVHNGLVGTYEYSQLGENELNAAKEYLKVLKKYNLKSTLFLNGILLETETEKIKELLNYNVEFGGHTYNNFGKMNLFKSYLYRKFFGCIYGPSSYQRKDIKKTKITFEDFGIKMTSWRTHSFGSNEKTFELLKKEGVEFVSDLLGHQKPFRDKNGLIHLPINIPVDQNTIAYGILKPENRNPFASCTKGRIKAEEWFEIIKSRIIENEKKGIDSILLLHPSTMALLDNFKLLDKICKFLSKYKSGKISEFILK